MSKNLFSVYCTLSYFSVLGYKIYTHERREHYATGGCLPHQVTVYSLILAYHPTTRLFPQTVQQF